MTSDSDIPPQALDSALMARAKTIVTGLDQTVRNDSTRGSALFVGGDTDALPLLDVTTDDLREVLEVNLIGAFVVMRESIRKMQQHGSGDVINIASDAAIKGIGGMSSYVASKHGLLGMGRSIRQEMHGSGIRVSTFCPGPITAVPSVEG